MDRIKWDQLSVKTVARYMIKGQDDYRFYFIRDDTGKVTALPLVPQGIPMPLAKKVK